MQREARRYVGFRRVGACQNRHSRTLQSACQLLVLGELLAAKLEGSLGSGSVEGPKPLQPLRDQTVVGMLERLFQIRQQKHVSKHAQGWSNQDLPSGDIGNQLLGQRVRQV